MEAQDGLAQLVIGDGNCTEQCRRPEPRPERLGEGFLGSEALGEKAPLVAGSRESWQFIGGEKACHGMIAVALPHSPQAIDGDDVGAYSVDHSPCAAASRMSFFISRTASRNPTNSERLTMA